jgi:catechol 2,3-dioxygenase
MRDPEELEATAGPVSGELPADTHMGAVHLGVADLGRSLDYYRSALGLQVHSDGGGSAALGAGGPDLLVLNERPGARPARGVTGLYHFALLVPERADLARFLAHVARERIALTGLSDHYVSEAIYLRDPDEHGIEVYWDRPREIWEGRVGETLTTEPLDVDDLLGVLGDPADAPFDGLAGGTVMGHVHLRVADVPEAAAFYDDLGFALMAQLGRQAAFLAAGGYHHHIGANSWESAGAPPAPEGVATLERMTVVVPGLEAERSLRDPSGNPVVLTPS